MNVASPRFASRSISAAVGRRIQYGSFRSSRRYATASYAESGASISTEAEIGSARQYCLNLIRKYDTPSFLLQSYIPQQSRDAYLAIRAFNIEIARTADTTSTPTIGAIRLQFHREAVTKALAGTPPKQPIAILIAHALESLQQRTNGRSKFSKSWFMRIINSREQSLSNPPYPDIAAIESYAENTYSTLMYLTLQAYPVASVTADHIASHIGKATGIATILRGLPLLAFPPPPNNHSNQDAFSGSVGSNRQGAVMLPLDIMAQHGVREEDVLRNGAEAQGLKDAVFTVATRANDHLITAREMLKTIRAGKEADHDFEHGHEEEHVYEVLKMDKPMTPIQEIEKSFGVFMPAISTSLWLERLEKHDFDVFAPKLRVTDWRLPWKAFWSYNRRQL